MFGSNTVIVEKAQDEKTEKMIEYIRNLNAIEEAMEPYKEQKRELRKDIDQFVSIFESLSSAARGGS